MACSERESLERQIRFLSGLIQKHKTDHSLSGHFTNCTFRRVNSSGLPKPVGPNRFSLINHPGITCTQLPERKNSAFEKLKAIKTARRAAGNRLTLLQQHRNIITTTSPGNAVKNPGQPVEKLQHRSSEAIRRLIPATESIEKLLPKVVLSSAHKITTRSPQAQLVVMPTSSCPSKTNLPTCSVVPSNNNVKQSLYVFTNDKNVYEKACFAPLSGKAMHSKFRVTKDKVVHDLTVAAARTSSPSKGSTCSSPVLQSKDGRLCTLGTKPFQNVETSTPLSSKTCRTLKSEYVWTADAARADSSPVGTMSKVKSIAHDVHMLSPILSLPSHQNKSPESPNCSPVKHSLQRESVHIKSSSKLLSGAGLSHHSSSGCSAKYSTSSSHSAQPLMSRYRWKAVSPRSRISAGSPSTASVQTRLSLTVPRSVYKVKSRTKIVKRKILNTTAQGGSIGTSTLRGQASRSQPKIYCTISKHKIRKLPFSRTPSQGKRGGRAKKSQVYVNQKGIHYSASHRGRTLQRIRSPRTESGRPVGGKGFVRSPPVSALELSHSRRLASQALQRSLMVARQAQLRRNKTKEFCIFYNRFGKCNRGEECRYIHDPDKIAVCTRFIRGTCKKTDASCQFSHKVTKEKMPVCRYYIRGMCNNSDCMYSHVKVSRKAGVCEDFVKGYCPLGAKCKKEHTLECSEFVASGKCPHGATCRLHHPHTRKHKCKAIVPEEGLAHMKKKVRGNGARPSISGKTSKDPVTSGACVRSRGQQDEDKMSSCNNIGRLPSYIALDESSLPETQAPEPHLAEKAVQSGQALHIKPRF